MNAYFLDPNDIDEGRFPFLLNILKVKKVICFADECPQICGPLLIYKSRCNDNTEFYYNGGLEKEIKNGVYKFNEPICSLDIKNGKWNGKFIINDIYNESNAFNPIYNLEHCNDDNVLILLDYGFDLSAYVTQKFSQITFNILRKYASDLHYENRICFIQLFYDYESEEGDLYYYSFPYSTKIYYKGYFQPFRRFIPLLPESKFTDYYKLDTNRSYSVKEISNIRKQGNKVLGRLYDPLISYIDIKLNELYPNEREGLNILDFFHAGYLNEEFHNRINEIIEEEQMRENWNSSTDSNYWQSELDYITGNGGDWIND